MRCVVNLRLAARVLGSGTKLVLLTHTSFPHTHTHLIPSHTHTHTHTLTLTHTQVTVYCEWLAPVHIATLPLTVYNPFSVTCREHSAGDNTFLQLILLNSCPLPLSIRDPMLAADLELSSLHSNLPDVSHTRHTFLKQVNIVHSGNDIHSCLQCLQGTIPLYQW